MRRRSRLRFPRGLPNSRHPRILPSYSGPGRMKTGAALGITAIATAGAGALTYATSSNPGASAGVSTCVGIAGLALTFYAMLAQRRVQPEEEARAAQDATFGQVTEAVRASRAEGAATRTALQNTHNVARNIETSQVETVATLQSIQTEMSDLRNLLEQHLTSNAMERTMAGDLQRQAAEKVAQEQYHDAETILMGVIEVIRNTEIAASTAKVCGLLVDVGRTALLDGRTADGIRSFLQARDLAPVAHLPTWRYALYAFLALSFDPYLDIGVKPEIRTLIFDGYIDALSENLMTSGEEAMVSAASGYAEGQSHRKWSMSANSAGHHLFSMAKEHGDRSLALAALLGYEYMYNSYHSADDPIDIESTLKNRLRVIHFLDGKKNPSTEDLAPGNIFKFL